MRLLLTAVVALLFASPADAQLAPPNSAGITFAHVHLNVSDIELHKKLWVEQFGGVLVQKGQLVTIRLPNFLIALSDRAPTGDSRGTVMDHFGFKVRNMAVALEKWRAAGLPVGREFTGAEGFANAYVMAPDGVRVELQEDPELENEVEGYHIHFFTEEYEELLDWYVDMFSLEKGPRGTIETTAWAPGQNLSFAGTQTERVATRGRAIDHIGFEVEDLKAFCDLLEARGVTFDVPYREIPSIELKIAFFTDPSGVRIELTEGFDKY